MHNSLDRCRRLTVDQIEWIVSSSVNQWNKFHCRRASRKIIQFDQVPQLERQTKNESFARLTSRYRMSFSPSIGFSLSCLSIIFIVFERHQALWRSSKEEKKRKERESGATIRREREFVNCVRVRIKERTRDDQNTYSYPFRVVNKTHPLRFMSTQWIDTNEWSRSISLLFVNIFIMVQCMFHLVMAIFLVALVIDVIDGTQFLFYHPRSKVHPTIVRQSDYETLSHQRRIDRSDFLHWHSGRRDILMFAFSLRIL